MVEDASDFPTTTTGHGEQQDAKNYCDRTQATTVKVAMYTDMQINVEGGKRWQWQG